MIYNIMTFVTFRSTGCYIRVFHCSIRVNIFLWYGTLVDCGCNNPTIIPYCVMWWQGAYCMPYMYKFQETWSLRLSGCLWNVFPRKSRLALTGSLVEEQTWKSSNLRITHLKHCTIYSLCCVRQFIVKMLYVITRCTVLFDFSAAKSTATNTTATPTFPYNHTHMPMQQFTPQVCVIH